MSNTVAGGESSLPRPLAPRYSRSDYSIFIDNTEINVDLSDHGNAADCTPVTLWGKWAGKNQVWSLEPASEA